MSTPATQPTSSRWKGWLRDAVIILVIILAVRAWQHQDVVTGEPPALAGVSLTGQPIALSDFAGQPLLIHFLRLGALSVWPIMATLPTLPNTTPC